MDPPNNNRIFEKNSYFNVKENDLDYMDIFKKIFFYEREKYKVDIDRRDKIYKRIKRKVSCKK